MGENKKLGTFKLLMLFYPFLEYYCTILCDACLTTLSKKIIMGFVCLLAFIKEGQMIGHIRRNIIFKHLNIVLITDVNNLKT